MKTVRFIVLLVLSIFVFTGNSYSQSMTISGGGEYGMVICNKGLLYAWGNNFNKALGIDPAEPGTTPSAAVVKSPQKVKLPTLANGTPITMQQVVAGSGAFSVALSCNGVVYAWGGNESGECGQGTTSTVIPFPVPVKKGAATIGYNEDGTPGGPYLGGVKYVAAATASAYAILETGEVLSWGSNANGDGLATGQLANGTMTSASTPTYVLSAAGTRLTGVTHVSGGDYTVYFVAGANNTVYSAGDWIGRSTPPTVGTVAQNYAGIVQKKVGTVISNLTNTVMTAAGDVHGVAVDKDGNVFGWGNNYWGCCAVGVTSGDVGGEKKLPAVPVAAGEYEKISDNRYLTDVVEVIGGRGYSAAVTKEGYVLYWGNAYSTNAGDNGANGGLIGNPSFVGAEGDGERNTCKEGPQFLFYCPKDTVKNAVHIARGDNFGFMVNDQDEYYAWGKNDVGQLGIGTSGAANNKRCLSPMTIPCEASDRIPEAYMPPETKKCLGNFIELHSGFNVAASKLDRYKFRWYYTPEGGTVETQLPDNTNAITTDKTGKYRVEIEYVGDNMNCNMATFAQAQTMLTDKEVPIDTLIITTCVPLPANPMAPAASNQVCFAFNSKYTLQGIPSEFEVYKTQTGGTKTSTITVPETEVQTDFCVPGNTVNVAKVGLDTLYTVWLQDITRRAGTVYENAAPTNTANSVNRSGGQYSAEKFVISGDIVLQELSINIKNEWNPASGFITPQIYKIGTDNNGNDALGALVASGVRTAVSTAGGANNQPPKTITLSFGNLQLSGDPVRGTRYILVLKHESANNLDILYVPFVPETDDIDGTVLNTISAHQLNGLANLQQLDNDNKRVVFNWKFVTLPMYDCGRIQLTSKYYCPPCTKPTKVTILSNDMDTTLCPGGGLVLTSNDQANASDFEFIWYEKGVTMPSTGSAGISAQPKTIDYADLNPVIGSSTEYILLVRDKANPDAEACYVRDTISIRNAEIPDYILTAECLGNTATEGAWVEFTKGVGPFDYSFTIDGVLQSARTAADRDKTYLLDKQPGFYQLSGELSDTYCSMSVPTDVIVEVVKVSEPATPGLVLLKGTGSYSIKDAAIADADHEIVWYTTPTSSDGTTTAPQVSTAITGDTEIIEYWVTQKNTTTGCESERVKVIIEINNCPIPAPNTAEALYVICNYDATPMFNVTIGSNWDNGNSTRPSGLNTVFNFYASDGTFITSNTTGQYTPVIDKSTEAKHVFYVTESIDNLSGAWNPCEGPRTTITIDVKKPTNITITPANEEVCAGRQNPLFTANSKLAGASIEWYTSAPAINSSNDGSTAVAKADTYRPTVTTVGTQTIYAVQRTTDGCLSQAASQTWKIKAIPAAPSVTNESVCFNEPNEPVTATGTAIKWYASVSATTILPNGNGESYTSTETAVDVYKYYATQTVDGCESTDRGEATFTIVQLPATPIVTVSDPEICEYETEPTFTITNQENGSTVKWYKADKTTLLLSGTTNTYTPQRANGTQYYVTQTTACTSEFSAPVSFVINPKPATPIVVNQKMCDSEAIPYLSTDGISDDWFRFNDATGFIYTGRSYRPTAADIGSSDSITFYIQRTTKDCKSDIAPVYLKIIPIPTVEIQGGDKAICYAEEIDVTAHNFSPAFSNGSRLQWAVINEDYVRKPVNESSEHTITLNSTILPEHGEYTVEVVYEHDYAGKMCESMPVQVRYTVYPQPDMPIVQNQVRCESTTMEPLSSFGSPLVMWHSIDGKLPDWVGTAYSFEQMNLTNVAVGTYEFELYDTDALTQCQSERALMTFEVAPKAVTEIVGDTALCVHTIESAYALAQVPPRLSTYEWRISGDRNLYARDNNSTSLRYVDWDYAGIDTIWVTERTWAGCEGRDSIVVRVAPLPNALFTAENAAIGIETSLRFTNQSTQEPLTYTDETGTKQTEEIPYTMFWNFGRIDLPHFITDYVDTIVEYEQRNQSIVVHDFKYGAAHPTLKVVNSYGCTSTYTTEVFVDITTGFYIPSAFAPTNPAASVRIFKPVAFNLEYCKVWIYDTWGNLLWYGDRVENGVFVDEWDGIYGGELLPSGTYIWHIDARFLNGKKWKGTRFNSSGNPKVRGSVVLIR
ncbi:MAG: hypothetical protein LBM68_04795 [Bacteroidales bacterium]|nr:hypothetical protein [Bacteroidales bacterium]